jgi:hypothetical protein
MTLAQIVPYDPALYAGPDSEVAVVLESGGLFWTIWYCATCDGWTVERDSGHVEFSSCRHDLEDHAAWSEVAYLRTQGV